MDLQALLSRTTYKDRQPTYRSWHGMHDRCRNHAGYHGRGITVCEKWQDYRAFLEDMGLRPEGKTIDRINNDGNYEPGNCQWADSRQQANNRRRRTRWKRSDERVVLLRGREMPLVDAASALGITGAALRKRIYYYTPGGGDKAVPVDITALGIDFPWRDPLEALAVGRKIVVAGRTETTRQL